MKNIINFMDNLKDNNYRNKCKNILYLCDFLHEKQKIM